VPLKGRTAGWTRGGHRPTGPAGRAGAAASRLPDGTKGLLLVGTGVLLLSPDALVIRLLDLDAGTLLFFRGAFSVVGYLAILQLLSGGALRARTWALSRSELLVGCLFVIANVFFVLAIQNSNAALALVIFASAPAITTLIGRAVGFERVPRRTWIASTIVLAGVAAIFLTEPRGGSWLGAAAALGGSLALATTLVVRRAGDVRVLPSQAAGALFTGIVALPFASPLATSGEDLRLALFAGLLLLPVATAMIMHGPRYLTAPEVSLLLLLESILGPLWIWIALGDPPTEQAVLAGALILGTLATHSVLAERALRRGRGATSASSLG